MKHFFFAVEKGEAKGGLLQALLREWEKIENESGQAEREEASRGHLPEEKKLEILYDMVDVIYDKRLGEQDGELNVLRNKEWIGKFFQRVKEEASDVEASEKHLSGIATEQGTQAAKGGSQGEGLKKEEINDSKEEELKISGAKQLEALKAIHLYVEENIPEALVSGAKTAILKHYLVRGNLAIRISQIWHTENKFKKMEKWGGLASKILWQGLMRAEQYLEGPLKADEKNELWLLKLLLKYNLAVYYFNYARRNRRSNFATPDGILREIENEFERHHWRNIDEVQDTKQARQLVLIYLETRGKHISIQRRRYEVKEAEKGWKSLLWKILKEKQPECEEVKSLLKENSRLDIEEKENQEVGEEGQLESFLPYFRHLPAYDIYRYSLLVLLELARVYRDYHKTGFYEEAFCFTDIAAEISRRMDIYENEDKRHTVGDSYNIDAMIILSSIMRKFSKFIDRKKREKAEKLYDFIDPKKENLSDWQMEKQPVIEPANQPSNQPEEQVANVLVFQNRGTVFQKLKEWAASHHWGAKTEMVKWYCLFLQKGANAKGMFAEPDFPKVWEDIREYFLVEGKDRNSKYQIIASASSSSSYQLLFYLAMVYLNEHKYEEAVSVLRKMIDTYPEESRYIRFGTLGLKSRYLLADGLMSLGRFAEAKDILEFLFQTMEDIKESDPERQDVGIDRRVLIDLVYCCIRQGDFGRGLELFQEEKVANEAAKDSKSEEEERKEFEEAIKSAESLGVKGEKIDFQKYMEVNRFLSRVKRSRRICGLNNLISCCLFAEGRVQEESKPAKDNKALQGGKKNPDGVINTNDNKEWVSLDGHKGLALARHVFCYLKWIYPNDYIKDQETNLLKAYFVLLTGQEPEKGDFQQSEISHDSLPLEWLARAHEHFKVACDYANAFSKIYLDTDILSIRKSDTILRDHLNAAKKFNRMQYISAFLVNLVNVYYKTMDANQPTVIVLADGKEVTKEHIQERSRNSLERFINGFPINCTVFLNAAIALAEWILDEEKAEGSPKMSARMEQLYRSFGGLTLYGEQEADVFNRLREDQDFRLMKAEQRGKIRALLLAIYKPIKALKDVCAFHLDDKKNNEKNDGELVHYTTLETLKPLFSTDYSEGATIALVEEEPRLRLNNCGYMNDLFEGHKLLNCLELVVKKKEGEKSKEEGEEKDKGKWDFRRSLLYKYFPELIGGNEDVHPNASRVYFGSLSVHKDSFPMWKIYSDDEMGCNLTFEQSFFDICGKSYSPHILWDYMPSFYENKKYPLYNMNYIGKGFTDDLMECNLGALEMKYHKAGERPSIVYTADHTQASGTRAIRYENLFTFLLLIYEKWRQLDDYLVYLEGAAGDRKKQISAVRQFAADRLNEIRFLFKDSTYAFEGEVRILFIDAQAKQASKTDLQMDSPRVYVDVERDLKNLTVRLGSRIESAKVNHIVTWLSHTGRVSKVVLSECNRLSKG